jgi:hypothetical protein
MVKDFALERLKKIGQQLDADIFPRVLNGGIVTPDDTASPNTNWAKEIQYEQQGQRRSATGPGTGTAGRQRQTHRSGETGPPPPLVGPSLQEQYESELTEVQLAYPGTRVWRHQDGLWLLSESTLLHGILPRAIFLTGIPFSRRHVVRSWGFWAGTPQSYPSWIGPRHTNFPDGSICAFEQKDGTWRLGDSLVGLLDLYTVWALRQLHLKVLGRWPGRQWAHFLYERLTETLPGEYCGCGSNALYECCCRPDDIRRPRVLAAIQYFSFGGRNPPTAIQQAIREQKKPPAIKELLPVYELSALGEVRYEVNV